MDILEHSPYINWSRAPGRRAIIDIAISDPGSSPVRSFQTLPQDPFQRIEIPDQPVTSSALVVANVKYTSRANWKPTTLSCNMGFQGVVNLPPNYSWDCERHDLPKTPPTIPGTCANHPFFLKRFRIYLQETSLRISGE